MKRLFYCGFTLTVSSETDVLYVNTALQLTINPRPPCRQKERLNDSTSFKVPITVFPFL